MTPHNDMELLAVELVVGVCITISSWALKKIIDLHSKLAASEAVSAEREKEINRRFDALQREMDQRLSERIESQRAEFGFVKEKLEDLSKAILALHARLDKQN